VNVVGGAVDDERRGMQFADDPSKVGEKVGTNVRTYQREAGFGAEDQVEDNIAKRMRQFLSPLRGLPPFHTPTHGLRRGL